MGPGNDIYQYGRICHPRVPQDNDIKKKGDGADSLWHFSTLSQYQRDSSQALQMFNRNYPAANGQFGRRHFPGAAAITLAAVPLVLLGFVIDRSGGILSSLSRGNAWLNTQPLTAASLTEKVVLIDFWTYTCINWLRTFPYVRAWAEKYKDQGLVVIGVHRPEFSFQHDVDNVLQSAKERNVDYPSVIANDHAIFISPPGNNLKSSVWRCARHSDQCADHFIRMIH
jgi:thiol-disulfide isomerase/thioredoxin